MLKSMLSLRKIPFGRFRRDRSGNFAALTALAALPIMFTIGGAVDLNLFHTSRTKIQNAADAAALAAAKRFPFDPNETRLKQLAQDYFDANVGSLYRTRSTLHYEGTRLNENNIRELTIGVEFAYDPVFLPLMGNLTGLDGTNRLESVVAIGNTTVEMAMVLDTSGSMDWIPAGGGERKIVTLRRVAANAINQLFTASQMSGVEEPVRLSVVPFSGAVNLGSEYLNAPWLDPKGLSPQHHRYLDWSKYNYTALPDGYGESSNSSAPWNQERYKANQIAIRDPSSSRPQGERPWVLSGDHRTYLTRQYIYQNLRETKASFPDRVCPRGLGYAAGTVCTWSGSNRSGWSMTASNGARCSQSSDAQCHPPYTLDRSGSKFFEDRVCAESREGPFALTADTPTESDPRTLFVPFFAPDDPDSGGNQFFTDRGTQVYNWSTRSTETRNAWTHPLGTTPMADYPRNDAGYPMTQKDVRRYLMPVTRPGDPGTNRINSPFHMCDSDKLVPLSANPAGARQTVQNLTATGATNVEEGIAWGWRTLTPEEPFSGARKRGDENNFKALVVMTDGANTYYASGNPNRSTYGAHGYSAEGRIFQHTSFNAATVAHNSVNFGRAMDERTATLCENVKNDGRVPVKTAQGYASLDGAGKAITRDGVLIYTIAFDIPQADKERVDKLLRDCASATIADQNAGRPLAQSQKYFYSASSNAELERAFNDIIASLTALRIAR